MTRKRFIKLLMAQGHSRNEANEFAVNMRELGLTYDAAYRIYFCVPKVIDIIAEKIREFTETVEKMTKAFCDAADAFGAAFRKSTGKD